MRSRREKYSLEEVFDVDPTQTGCWNQQRQAAAGGKALMVFLGVNQESGELEKAMRAGSEQMPDEVAVHVVDEWKVDGFEEVTLPYMVALDHRGQIMARQDPKFGPNDLRAHAQHLAGIVSTKG